MAVRQRRLFCEKRQFCDFNSLPWQRVLRSCKMIYYVSKPFHPSTNPEILVKISLLDSEKQVVECRPSKIYKIKKKNIGKITARLASLPSGLSNTEWHMNGNKNKIGIDLTSPVIGTFNVISACNLKHTFSKSINRLCWMRWRARTSASTSTFERRGWIKGFASTGLSKVCRCTYRTAALISSGCPTSTFRTRKPRRSTVIRCRTEAFASIRTAQFDIRHGKIRSFTCLPFTTYFFSLFTYNYTIR